MNKKWYERPGERGDIVVSTRIRLARNLAGMPFPCKMTPEQRTDVSEAVRDALLGRTDLPVTPGYYAPGALTADAKRSLGERYLLSREFAESGRGRALLLSEDESVSLLLCEKDHIRLQVMAAGLELTAAYQLANTLDDMIGEKLAYAFDESLGYLTESPADLGTGMKASVLLHLPALEAVGGMDTVAAAVGKIGLTLRGTFGEGSSVSGSLYQLSNRITMGLPEEEVIENLRSVTLQVIARELDARKQLTPLQVEDAAWRSLGLLQNARILPMREFTDALSRVRLGASMGLFAFPDMALLNRLSVEMHPATLLLAHPDADSTEKRDVQRAALVRQALTQKE